MRGMGFEDTFVVEV